MADASSMAKARAQPDFRAYSSDDQLPNARFYFIESTAPDNVEQRADPGESCPKGLTCVDPDKAAREIAETLTPSDDPGVDANLVIMVHGVNTPRDRALDFYGKALAALENDRDQLFGGAARRTVFVAYRWPSERVGSVSWSSLSAFPTLPLAVLAASALAIALCVWLLAAALKFAGLVDIELTRHLLARFLVVCGLAVFVFAIFAVLRALTYFRDVYRATNHGAPDLIEVIRQIDREAVQRLRGLDQAGVSPLRRRIALSFIGHSTGGLIVTNAIRVLSDVFSEDVIRTYLSGKLRPEMATREREGMDDEVSDRVGHVFALRRFVLISPDIPAEALLADRANFLASSLRRFREAYLFSNAGDVILRANSTALNYFTFPTRSRIYGYRLGNAEILASGFGAAPPGANLLDVVRAGTRPLSFLSDRTTRGQKPASVARAFTFFDCTDYKDDEPPRGMLTEAKNFKRNDPEAGIPLWEQLRLLALYLFGRVDVHAGYFNGPVAQRLIYRLACLGYDRTVHSYGSVDAMLRECADHQIRVILSHRLHRTRTACEPMDLSSAPAARCQDS